MIYREAGDFKTSYAADGQTFPIAFDRWRYWAGRRRRLPRRALRHRRLLANAILLPFLIWSIAAIGLNILTGYCGQVSLGTGGFMAVGAFASFKLMTAFPELNIAFAVLGARRRSPRSSAWPSACRASGSRASTSPSPRSPRSSSWSGCSTRCRGSINYSATGQINAPVRSVLGWEVTGAAATPAAKYLFCLAILFVLAWVARNLTRGRIGRSWMAIRDMDIAAEIIGVSPLRAKLSAFAVSSFFVGVAGRALLRGLLRRGRGHRRLRHPRVVPRALHDHHRRPRARSSAPSPARPSWCCCRSC